MSYGISKISKAKLMSKVYWKSRRNELLWKDGLIRDYHWEFSSRCFRNFQQMATPGTREVLNSSYLKRFVVLSCKTCSQLKSTDSDKSTRNSPLFHKPMRIPSCVSKRRFEIDSQSLLRVQCHFQLLFVCSPNGKALKSKKKSCNG